MKYLIGLDLGTSSCKAIAIDLNGNIVAEASESYELKIRGKYIEQKPEDWWASALNCLSRIVEHLRTNIVAIGISSQANTLLTVDKNGIPLMNAISWLDQRSEEELNEIIRTLGYEEIHDSTGMIPNAGFTAPKVLWLKRRQGKIFSRVFKLLFSPQSYIVFKLTGRFIVDRTLASFSMLYNIREGCWWSDLIELLELNEDILPDVVDSHQEVGELKEDVMRKLGLEHNVSVIAGAHDQCCAALGAGLTDTSMVIDSTGTASAIIGMVEELPPKIPRDLLCYHYVIPDSWTILGTISTSGALIDWFLKLSGLTRSYENIERLAEKVDVGSNGVMVLPYFSGSFRADIPWRSRGTIVGLTLSHGVQHIYRAIMESLAFECRYFLDLIRSINPLINKVVLVGGGTKSRLWTEIKANVYNLRILKPAIVDTAPLGAAIIAGVGTKVFRDYSSAVSSVIRFQKEIVPKDEHVAVYEDLYKKYLILSSRLGDLLSSL
ncbi:MAG: hypothetical protein DRJ49_06600 [Thermoprotei archaeon]|nr:MAG: hypothetical protein DRJ49_06600 [Thermoprotei archaeon]